ncbi:MAG: hypothetical protein GEU82_15430 [Luteitalea sp.]|nr:hypothetical protein [Luteitalea sp.]
MVVLIAALIVAGAVAWAGSQVAREIRSGRRSRATADEERVAQIIGVFAPGIAAAADDPRALLVWQPVASAARELFPHEFGALDQAFGRTFPFTLEQMQAAHARWTTDWLGWERTHDGECKLKAAAIEEELGERTASPYGRARLEAVEREKLERYQRRYEEYTRTSKALQGLIQTSTAARE